MGYSRLTDVRRDTSESVARRVSELDCELSRLRQELEQQLEQMFQQAIERGEIPAGDPRAYACMLHGTMTAQISRWVRNDESHDELWASATDLKRLLRRGLGITPS